LRIFAATHSPEYSRVVFTWYCQLRHLRESKHPAYQLVKLHSTLLNEEPGEICLSQLARLQGSVHQRSSISVTNRNYQLLPLTSQIAEMFSEPAGYERQGSGFVTLSAEDEEVKVATSFFEATIRRLVCGQFVHYVGPIDKWKSRVACAKAAALNPCSPYFPSDTTALLQPIVDKTALILDRDWLGAILGHSPRLQPLFPGYNEAKEASSLVRMEPEDPSSADDDFLGPESPEDLLDPDPQVEMKSEEPQGPPRSESILPPSDLSDASKTRVLTSNVRSIIDWTVRNLEEKSEATEDSEYRDPGPKRPKHPVSPSSATIVPKPSSGRPARKAKPRPGSLFDAAIFYTDPSESEHSKRKRRKARGH